MLSHQSLSHYQIYVTQAQFKMDLESIGAYLNNSPVALVLHHIHPIFIPSLWEFFIPQIQFCASRCFLPCSVCLMNILRTREHSTALTIA